MADTPNAPTSETSPPKKRLMSVDALRGFDMFWIIGADSLVYALHRMSENRTTKLLATQLEHVDWEGFRFYDLIFPMFVFIMGVSLVFSLTKTVEQHGRNQALKRIIIRSLLLFAAGLFYSGGLSRVWPDMRLMGVLNRIAIAYFFGGLLFIYFKPRVLAGICASILLGYWAVMALTPIRSIQLTRSALATAAEQSGDSESAALLQRRGSIARGTPAWEAAEKVYYATTNYVLGKNAVITNTVRSDTATNQVVSRYPKGFNLANHFDFEHLPGRKYDTFWDPEGLLSNIPAIATCLLGVFAGLLLRSARFCDKWKVIYLASFGVAGVLLGWLWGLEFPVIKKIWSSSYVLVAGGYSALLLAAFYLIVDVLKWQKWSMPFVWIGVNPITIYIASALVSWRGIGERFTGGDVQRFLDTHVAKGFGGLVITLTGLLLAILFVRFLYKRNIFLRL